ncbi:MAG TPA: YHS domain-containing protein [Puia sp.]|nr:YHS domain-containing protein [Puia sp.]
MKHENSFLSRIHHYIIIPGFFVLPGIYISCNQKPNPVTISVEGQKSDSAKKKFTAAMVNNKKDPSCGMPLTAGIEDTVHYNGKVYGFCSDECKQIFLKDPKTLAKNAEMKN